MLNPQQSAQTISQDYQCEVTDIHFSHEGKCYFARYLGDRLFSVSELRHETGFFYMLPTHAHPPVPDPPAQPNNVAKHEEAEEIRGFNIDDEIAQLIGDYNVSSIAD